MSSLFDHPEFDYHENVHFCSDRKTGLRAIIAIHNSTLGPSTGGCRMYPYSSDEEAITDALRLSKGMTYKSALAGIPLGGGKSVIIGNPVTDKSEDLMLAMGEFINSLDGQYIAAEDSGTTTSDMEIISRKTKYVSGLAKSEEEIGDPSPSTALGVFLGIKRAVTHKFQSDLKGLTIAVQGVGSVGYHLIHLLTEDGAKVIATDTNPQNLSRAKFDFDIETCDIDEITSVGSEIFAPCAMGATVNRSNLAKMQASIIAGAANNQLKDASVLEVLHERDILYAPDYVINAGGIIDIYYQTRGITNRSLIQDHISQIDRNLKTIFEQARNFDQPTSVVADRLAEGRFLSPANAI